jgi:hypothetical protein
LADVDCGFTAGFRGVTTGCDGWIGSPVPAERFGLPEKSGIARAPFRFMCLPVGSWTVSCRAS